jgi:hypothetical protein
MDHEAGRHDDRAISLALAADELLKFVPQRPAPIKVYRCAPPGAGGIRRDATIGRSYCSYSAIRRLRRDGARRPRYPQNGSASIQHGTGGCAMA